MNANANWDSIIGYPQTAFNKAYDFCCACAGEGEEVSPEQLGKDRSAFTYETLMIIRIEESPYEVVYSIDHESGALAVDLMRCNPL